MDLRAIMSGSEGIGILMTQTSADSRIQRRAASDAARTGLDLRLLGLRLILGGETAP